MAFSMATVHRKVEAMLRAPVPIPVDVGVRRIMDHCARHQPHRDWARLRALDYAAEIPRLDAWLDGLIANDPPMKTARGFFFNVCNPGLPDGSIRTDIELIGTPRYDPNDVRLDWLYTANYYPRPYAQSPALHEMHGIAYGGHRWWLLGPKAGVLGNDAEYPIGLAFGALAARELMGRRTPTRMGTRARAVGVAAGWGEGDVLFVGELTARGLASPRAPAAAW